MTARLYVVVDGTLPPGLQIAQAIHAKDEFTREHPHAEQEWARTSNTISVLQVAGEQALRGVIDAASTLDVPHSFFEEPDLDGRVTAVALAPTMMSARIVRGLKPALS